MPITRLTIPDMKAPIEANFLRPNQHSHDSKSIKDNQVLSFANVQSHILNFSISQMFSIWHDFAGMLP